ncbi:MAG: class I SAM-dependent methyltransferase, partial [Thiobacillus sp.]|nr:class I SAM-dependent methyltransferase [Thiobacillus sp.]
MRPVPEDLAFIETVLSDWCGQAGGRAPRGLILGVTPELYRLPWPDRSLVRAADRTPEMIEYVWPGAAEAVLHSDWRELDVADASFDIVLCDGGLHLLVALEHV